MLYVTGNIITQLLRDPIPKLKEVTMLNLCDAALIGFTVIYKWLDVFFLL